MDWNRIGVLGTGNVGRTLAAGLAAVGHDVRLGGRDPQRDELVDWSAEIGVPVTDTATAAADSDVVLLATAWDGTENALSLAGAGLDGTVLIDVTNPLVFDGRLKLAIGHDDSGGEQVQRWAPGATVVKAFNTVGYELMVHPGFAEGQGTMFIAGDVAEAKAVAVRLANDLGWGTHDCGGLMAARLTEPLAMIWIEHAIASGERRHVFRLHGASG